MNRLIKTSIFLLLICQTLCHAFANDNTVKYKKDIEDLIHAIPPTNKPYIGERINWFSQQLLNKPYQLFALGEGEYGEFDQHPLYRTDRFDCETLVDTVLALAHAQDFESFKHHILEIRYQNGHANLLTRNHFTNIDWNSYNQKKNYVKDITPSITWKNQPIFLKATTFINKRNWYQHLPINTIKIPNLSETEKMAKLKQLKKLARSQITNANSIITYIPTHILFDEHQNARQEIFQQIPQGAIIEIVRPQWNLEDKIGTRLDISHLGFAIWKNNVLYFRNASSISQRVLDEKLENYLKKTLDSPTIKGIHIEKPQEIPS